LGFLKQFDEIYALKILFIVLRPSYERYILNGHVSLSLRGHDVSVFVHDEIPATGSVLDELQTCALRDVRTSGEREVPQLRDAAQVRETSVGQLLTSGQVDPHETATGGRVRLGQHVHSAVRDARAVAEVEARQARHEAHDERHRRVGDVTSGEVERLAAVQPADGVIHAGSVVQRRREKVFDARVAHALRPLQIEADQQRAGR